MGLEEPATPTELDDIYKQFSSTLKPRNAQEKTYSLSLFR